jgi:hypothetical protein
MKMQKSKDFMGGQIPCLSPPPGPPGPPGPQGPLGPTLHISAPHNPQLYIAVWQMAQAMALLAPNSVAPHRSTCTSSRAPDTFDGSDLSKFTTFMLQIYLCIAERPQDFPTDDEKIFYVRSYLCGTAQ